MGNDAVVEATIVGDLPVMICNSSGEELYPARLRDVKVLPKSAFNLLSSTVMQEKGWKLYSVDTRPLHSLLASAVSSLRT